MKLDEITIGMEVHKRNNPNRVGKVVSEPWKVEGRGGGYKVMVQFTSAKPEDCILPQLVPVKQDDKKPFKVMSRQCDECLFSKNTVVRSEEAAQDIIDDCLKNDRHFICHKSTIAKKLHRSPYEACCNGFWNLHGEKNTATRMARIMGFYEMVDVEQFKINE